VYAQNAIEIAAVEKINGRLHLEGGIGRGRGNTSKRLGLGRDEQ
jgi:hypothetical protein